VVLGPSTFNFAEAAELAVAAGAALRVQTMEQAVRAALSLVGDAVRREAMVQSAHGFAASNRGAAERTAASVLAIAEGASPMPARAAASPAIPPEERADPTLD
jgi:3-deoxy-D-manno-octulosonic-acid transferase